MTSEDERCLNTSNSQVKTKTKNYGFKTEGGKNRNKDFKDEKLKTKLN